MVTSESEFTFNGIECERLAPGESGTLETIMFSIVAGTPDLMYNDYVEELKRRHPAPRKPDPTAVCCTWNYGVFYNLDEQDCLKRMEIFGLLAPGGFFQIDHGYQPALSGAPADIGDKTKFAPGNKTAPTPELDAFYPEHKNAWDPVRFPSGPEGFAAACRANHLRPALWWSPRVAIGGRIAADHPGWLVTDKDGAFIKSPHYLLDYSVPEVREFLRDIVHTITKVWGFEGLKVDFFSWMFDHPGARFKNGGTGLRWKNEFTRMLASQLPPDGYCLYCISMPMGDPFPGMLGFTSFRAGLDIHGGDWGSHCAASSWMIPSVLASQDGYWMPNLDSCAGSDNVPVHERRARIAMAYLTGSFPEFSGKFEEMSRSLLADTAKFMSRNDPGTANVFIPDEDAFFGKPFPKYIVRKNRPGSRSLEAFGILGSIGFFNWTEGFLALALRISDFFGNHSKAEEFWGGDTIVPDSDSLVTARLNPHESLFIDIYE